MQVGASVDEVAVVGIAGKFPGANDYRQFWENLLNNIVSIRNVSGQRSSIIHNYSGKYAGFIDGVASFDHEFFNITINYAGWCQCR